MSCSTLSQACCSLLRKCTFVWIYFFLFFMLFLNLRKAQNFRGTISRTITDASGR